MNNTAKTIIIPPTDHERFIDFSRFPSGKEWFGRGVVMAGLSDLSDRYLIRYPNPVRYLAIVCGKGRFEAACDGWSGEISAGGFLLMIPGSFQYLRALEDSKMAFLLMRNNPSWPKHPMATRVDAEAIFHLMELAWKESRSYGETDSVNSDFLGEETVPHKLSELILIWISREIFSRPAPEGGEGTRLMELSNLWSAIDRHPEKCWTVDSMAEFCKVSTPHLFLLVRTLFCTSPYRMLESIRMRHAEALLKNTGLGMDEIALRCGYFSAYSFSRAFNKIHSIAPSKWRRKDEYPPEIGRLSAEEMPMRKTSGSPREESL